MQADGGVVVADLRNRLPEGFGDRRSSSFGLRWCGPRTTAEPEGSAQFRHQRVLLGFETTELANVGERPGLVEFIIELRESTPVGAASRGIEDIAERSRMVRSGLLSRPRDLQIENVKL